MLIVLLSIIVQILNWLNHKLINNNYDNNNNNKEKSIRHLKTIFIKFSKVPKKLFSATNCLPGKILSISLALHIRILPFSSIEGLSLQWHFLFRKYTLRKFYCITWLNTQWQSMWSSKLVHYLSKETPSICPTMTSSSSVSCD